MRWLLAIGALAAVLAPSAAQAQDVTLVVEPSIVAVGGAATVEVIVEGGTSIAGNPRIPTSAGYTLAFAGQSSSFQMARGSVSQSVTFSYRLVGKTVGEWTLGPAEVSIGGKKLRSPQLELQVVKGGGATGGSTAAPPAGAQHYALASASDARPFVGESFSWVLEVGSSARVRQPTLPALPDFGGLSAEPGIEPQWVSRREMRDGRRLEVFTAALPVFAVEPGQATIGGTSVVLPEVVGGSGMFARVRDLQLEAKPVPVNVRPLPPGKPADFSGAVGRFGLTTTIDSETVRAGETLTLSLKLSGTGALRAPEITLDLPDSVRVYDEDPQVQVSLVDGQVHSRAVFRKAIVPLEPGELRIPGATFVFLDPDQGRYATVRSRDVTVTVTGEAVAEPAVARSEGIAAGKEEVEILASDILPLRTGDRLLGRQGVGPGSPVILALLILPLLGFGGVAAMQARARAGASDRGRRAARNKEAREAEKRAKKAAAAGDAAAAEAAVRDWLSARMERSGASLSPGEAADTLEAAGAPRELGRALSELLAKAEAVRFGGEPAGSLADDLSAWLDAARKEWR